MWRTNVIMPLCNIMQHYSIKNEKSNYGTSVIYLAISAISPYRTIWYVQEVQYVQLLFYIATLHIYMNIQHLFYIVILYLFMDMQHFLYTVTLHLFLNNSIIVHTTTLYIFLNMWHLTKKLFYTCQFFVLLEERKISHFINMNNFVTFLWYVFR